MCGQCGVHVEGGFYALFFVLYHESSFFRAIISPAVGLLLGKIRYVAIVDFVMLVLMNGGWH